MPLRNGAAAPLPRPSAAAAGAVAEAPGVKLLLSAREAAAALAVCERTLWQLTADGKVKSIKIGRSVRYDRRDLQEFIDGLRQAEDAPKK
jgi:excisionase family DNA binding protein